MVKAEPKSEAVKLRSQVEKNARLNLEFRAGLSSLLRQYGVDVSDSILRDAVLAHPSELAPTAAGPIDLAPPKPPEIKSAAKPATSKATTAKKK
jgi:hypothetical protein